MSELSTDPQKTPFDERVEILYNSCLSRNEIARRLDVSTYQVDRAADRLGISFDADRTATAVAARLSQAAEKRSRIADKLLKIAETELDSVINGMGTPTDRKTCMTIAAIAVDKNLAIEAHESAHGEDVEMQAAMDSFTNLMRAINLSVEIDNREDDPNDH